MTAIAWDGVRLATDSCASNGYVTRTNVTKLWVHPHDKVLAVATCGTYQDCLVAIEWFKAGMPPDKPSVTSCGGIAILDDRSICDFDERFMLERIKGRTVLARGSAMEFVSGALLTGATSMHAIRAAAKHCHGCALPVQWYQPSSDECGGPVG